MTHKQAEMLEAIKARHGELHPIAEDSPLGEHILSNCVSDTYAYQCRHCLVVFTVEPDGLAEMWACTPTTVD